MRILIPFALALILTSSTVLAQLPPAPTRSPAASTPAQEAAIRAGIELHDQNKYEEAMARYQDVLKENPDNVTALFELSYSQLAKEQHQQSLDTARKGAEYRSDLLSMFYDVMGSNLDAMGKFQEAIAAYKRGIELVPEEGAGLYFNMAVTYHESLKDSEQARLALEKAVVLDPERAEAELMLGQLFQTGGYRTQAVLTLARFLILNPSGNASLQGYGLWRAVLHGSADTALTGAMRTPDKPVKNDEGDFAALDAFIDATQKTAAADMDKGTPEIVALIGQIDALFGRLSTQATSVRGSFVGAHYVPYFIELKQRDFVEPFVYWASQRAPLLGAREWVDANRTRVLEFLKWSEAYKWN